MDHRNFSASDLQFGVDAVQFDAPMFAGDHLQQSPVAVVVAEDGVDLSLIHI